MKSVFAIALLSLLVATSAEARKQQVYTIQFDGLCDSVTLINDQTLELYATTHLVGCAAAHAPSSNPIPGFGIIVKRNPRKTTARAIAVTDTQPDGTGAPVAYATVLDYPLVTGGGWTAYATSDGKTITPVATGTYTVK
jgi:hypothetical protein